MKSHALMWDGLEGAMIALLALNLWNAKKKGNPPDGISMLKSKKEKVIKITKERLEKHGILMGVKYPLLELKKAIEKIEQEES